MAVPYRQKFPSRGSLFGITRLCILPIVLSVTLIDRIFFFSDQRDAVQKKTFTKWVNKHLLKVGIQFSLQIIEFFRFGNDILASPEWSQTTLKHSQYLSHVMRKPVYVICEHKGADQPVHLCSLISTFVFTAWIV